MRDRKEIDSVGFDYDYLGYVYPRSQTRRGDSFDQMEELFSADGAAMAIKRRVLDESYLGVPFDTEYFCYYEETDLCWRIRLRGYKVMFAPNSIVYHYRGHAWGKEKIPPHLSYHYLKNHVSTLIKNYDFLNLVKWILPLITLEVSPALLALRDEPRAALARFTALVWPLKNLSQLWRKRITVQRSIRKVPDSEILRLIHKPNFNSLFKSLFR